MRLFDRSFEDQIGEDDSTLDGHWDLESAAVSDDGEPDRDQEAELKGVMMTTMMNSAK